MHKKGVFFIVDAIIAIFIVTIALISFFTIPVATPARSRIDSLSQDVMLFLSSTKVKNLNDAQWGATGAGWGDLDENVPNLENSLMQQLGVLYNNNELTRAQAMIDELVSSIVPGQFNFEIVLVDGGSEHSLYSRLGGSQGFVVTEEESSISVTSRSVIFGMDADAFTMWGPYTIEVTMWE